MVALVLAFVTVIDVPDVAPEDVLTHHPDVFAKVTEVRAVLLNAP